MPDESQPTGYKPGPELAFSPLGILKFQIIKDAAGERPFGAGTKMTPEQEYDIYESPTLGPRKDPTLESPRGSTVHGRDEDLALFN